MNNPPRKLSEYKIGEVVEVRYPGNKWRAGNVAKTCTESHAGHTRTEVKIMLVGGGEAYISGARGNVQDLRRPGEFEIHEQVEWHSDGKWYPAVFIGSDSTPGWCQVLTKGSNITTKLENVRAAVDPADEMKALREQVKTLEQKNKAQAMDLGELAAERDRLRQAVTDAAKVNIEVIDKLSAALIERDEARQRHADASFELGYWLEKAKARGYRIAQLEQELAQVRMQLGRAMEEEGKQARKIADMKTLIANAARILNGDV